MKVEVSPQDKEWLPKIATSIPIPPLAGPGAYKIVFKVEDVLAKTTAELPVPFQVRAHAVEPSDTLTVRNFHFYRDEEGTQTLAKGVYQARATASGPSSTSSASNTARRIRSTSPM